jgi:hypothetical protein
MTKTIQTLAIATLLGATAYVGIPAQAAPNFDGLWSVVIITEKGTCDRSYRYPVRISGGSVGYAGQASFNVSGRVNPNGAVTVTVSRGEQRANGSGRLASDWGAGTWSGGDCSGKWEAEKRS